MHDSDARPGTRETHAKDASDYEHMTAIPEQGAALFTVVAHHIAFDARTRRVPRTPSLLTVLTKCLQHSQSAPQPLRGLRGQ